MSNTLATLIKLAGQKVEKVQRELATARRQLAEVNFTQNKWREDIARADASALQTLQAGQVDGLGQAGPFAKRAGNELAVLAKVEDAMNQKITEITARLNGHFAEQKRYEILLEQHLLAERKKHAKKHQAGLDESAGNRRRQ